MPLNSGLNLNSGLSGVRPRPSGGIGLARPVASTSSIMAPSAAPVAPRPEPLALPKAAPKPQPAPQQTASGGGGEMNAFSKIGLLLSNVAAGMEGRPLPSRQIEENRLKREEMEMRKTAAKIEAIAAVGTIAGKVPGGNSDAVKTGLIEALGGDQDGFVDAMFAAPQIDEQMYGIAAPALASIYQTGGRELFMDTISSPERMKAIADREIASAREPANAKMDQIFGLLQKGAASGAVSPEIGQAISGTMTADTLRELNKSLPPAMRLRPAEISSVEENGWSGYGATILSKKVSEKVAEQHAMMPGDVEKHRQQKAIDAQYKSSGDGPSTVQEWNFFNNLSGDDQQRFLQMKRADRVVDIGGEIINVTPGLPGSAQPVVTKTLAPADQPENAASKAAAVDTAKMQVEKQTKFPKAQAALVALEQQNGVVIGAIDEALANVSPMSAGFGSMISGVPTTSAKALQTSLETIRANVGFDKLQDMRNNSPTGGALGPVSDFENKLLASVVRSLDQGLEPDVLRKNLEFIKQNVAELGSQRRAAFESDFAGFGAEKAPASPAQKAVDEMTEEEIKAELQRLKSGK